MKSFFRGYSLVVPMGLLLPICSCLVLLSLAQSNQDQNQPIATLSLNAQYSAEVSSWTDGVQPEDCEDKIALTYGGTVRWKLLPSGYGTPRVDPAVLGVHWGKSINAERTGSFTVSYQGGGGCTYGKPNLVIPTPPPAPVTWTYGPPSTQVPPDRFPGVSINLRRGEYSFDYAPPGATPTTTSGGINGLSPGTAPLCADFLLEHSLMKVAEITTGKFEPFSKDFRFTKSVTDSIDCANPSGGPPPETAPGTGSKGSGTMSFSYTLTFGNPEEVEAIMIPQPDGGPPYEQWMPVGGADEDTPGNTIAVKVVLQKKGQPGSTPAEKAQFKFELGNVSKEPGVCLNWPPAWQVKKEPDFDLKIVKQEDPQNTQNMLLETVDEHGQSAMSKDKLTEVVLTITSYDWGGWGELKVTAILDDPQHTPIVAHLKDNPNVEALSIPKDDNGNHIADAWEKDHVLTGSTQAESDDDFEPEGGHTGDGLSLYEEYRGFMTGGAHNRTSPNIKDFFVYDSNGLGLGFFGASDLSVHCLHLDEFTTVGDSTGKGNPFVVNFNHGLAHLCDVHVIWLENGEAAGRLGWAVGGPGTPKKIERVIIDVARCMGSRWKQLDVANTVAHELGHCCNVQHHGEDNYDTGEVWRKLGGEWYPLGEGDWVVAAPGMQNSGDQNCVMRYPYASYYQYAQGQYRWHDPNNPNAWVYGESYPPAELPGEIFCTSPKGTGVNAPDYKPVSKSGDATLGNCAAQICVNDLKH